MELCDLSMNVRASAESAWQMLVDWRTMPDWDIFMEKVDFDGPLAQGSVGTLKITRGPTVKLVVTSFTVLHSYTDEFSLLGSSFIFHHYVMPSEDETVTVRVVVEANGLLAEILAPFMKEDMRMRMPIVLNKFKEQIELQSNPT